MAAHFQPGSHIHPYGRCNEIRWPDARACDHGWALSVIWRRMTKDSISNPN